MVTLQAMKRTKRPPHARLATSPAEDHTPHLIDCDKARKQQYRTCLKRACLAMYSAPTMASRYDAAVRLMLDTTTLPCACACAQASG